MTVYKNMAFGLKQAKTATEEIDRRVRAAAEVLQITDYLDRSPRNLSGGQRQRVAIGRAIVREPAAFLFDEPLSNLDAQLRTQMRLEIKKLHQRVGNTIVFVTHDQVEAMTMADRIVIMKDGYIQQVGTPSQVYHKPANTFVAQFIGAPSMNMLRGQSTAQGVHLFNGTDIALPTPLAAGRNIVLGVRPDDLTTDAGTPVCEGKIAVQEPLGAETLIYVSVGSDTDVIAKASGRTPPPVGSTVRLCADPENIHIFDAETGVALV